MPGQGRLGDKAQVQADAHGCPACPHPGVGPAIAGSPDVFVNGRPALRVDDVGIHAACCGGNMWQAERGSATVFINGKAAFRKSDSTHHCGGEGTLVEGSDDVLVGDATSGGGGSAQAAALSAARRAAAAPASARAAGDHGRGSGDDSDDDRSAAPGATDGSSAAGRESAGAPGDEPTTKVLTLIELEDVLFRSHSAVLTPDRRISAGGYGDDGVDGIGVIAACIEYADEHQDVKLLVAGHADYDPDAAYCAKIAQLRSRTAASLVFGDRELFAATADDQHKTEDLQQILAWIAATRAWPCDPGPVDGDAGPQTHRALAAFKRSYNQAGGTPTLDENDRLDVATWRAFYDCYRLALLDRLGIDDATLDGIQRAMKTIDPRAVGCSDFHPVKKVPGPYRSDANRRVELLFFEAGQEPSMACHAGGACQPDACEIYDNDKYTRVHVPVQPHKLDRPRLSNARWEADDPDEPQPTPIRLYDYAGEPCRDTDALLLAGETRLFARSDGDGVVRAELPAGCKTVIVRYTPSDSATEIERRITLAPPPVSELDGVEARLANLGYPVADGRAYALVLFQSAEGLPPTGTIDDATRARLAAVHDGES